MDTEKLKLIIAEGEGLTVEFKEKYSSRIDRDIVALSNSKGGYILLGVNDGGKITGDQLTNRMKAEILQLARNCDPHINLSQVSQIGNVIVVEVSEGEEKPYSCSSGYFRRLDAVTQKMSQKEVRDLFKETTDLLFESLSCKGITFDDISLQKIKTFLKESEVSFLVNKTNLASFLSSVSVYKDDKINNVGAMMFASDINKFIPYVETILGAFKGVTKTHIYDRKDVRDDLLTQLNEAMAFLKKHLNVRSEIHEINRHEIYEIPLDALREAVVNALVHRDYSMRGTNISVNVFDDRVEVVSPGGFPKGITKSNFGRESVRRNLIIADLFHRMDKMEKVGSGIRRMRDLIKIAGLKDLVFESDTFFRVIFYRNPQYSLKGNTDKGSQTSSQRGSQTSSQRIIFIMRKNSATTIEELAKDLGISSRAIKKHIRSLREQGIIKRVGHDFGGHWEVMIKESSCKRS
jgi:ATP-dependent DNA helicase RecG